jgi:cytochrome P450
VEESLTRQDIYQNDRLLKARAYLVTQVSPTVYNLFNVIDRRYHRIKRRIIGQGINDGAMRRFEPLMLEHVNIFIQQLARSCEEGRTVVNMSERCKRLGFDVIGRLGFGRDLELQTDSRNRFMIQGMETSNYRSNLYIQFPLLKRIGMEVLLYPFILTRQLRYYRLIRDLIVARGLEGKDARPDLYSFVADIKDPETGQGVRRRELWSEAAFFIPAGKCHGALVVTKR